MENPERNIKNYIYNRSRPLPSIIYPSAPFSLKNASSYIDELNLTSANPIHIGHYTLRFEGIQSGDARFSLSKYGKNVDTALAQAGSTVSLNFENGDKGVEFKLADAVDDGEGGIVQLEDIISASSESTSVGIDNIRLLTGYHQDENMNIGFSISNPGKIGFSGTVTFESAYPDKFVTWDTNITMQIFRIFQNGRERTY